MNHGKLNTSNSWRSGMLLRDHGHRIHYAVRGSAHAPALLILHGGPGSGSSPGLARPFDFFDGQLIQFDQRGCGASTPLGATGHNDTAALITDIEALRRELQIQRWLVAGGSWGATLALAYAAAHRAQVAGLLLRNVFLAAPREIRAFFDAAKQHGADLCAALAERGIQNPDLAAALNHFFVKESDPVHLLAIAGQWRNAELVLAGSRPAVLPVPDSKEAQTLIAKYRVQAHYLANACFLGEAAVLAAARSAAGIPAAIAHGLQDPICAPDNARRVHTAMPGSTLTLVPGAGHDPFHPGMLQAARQGLAQLLQAAELG